MLEIITLPLSEIKPFKNNAKLHPQSQVEQIMRSIEKFGMNDPLAVDENNTLIEGHGRLLALQQMGYAEAPCIRLSHLSEIQKRAYILTHNKLTLNSGFDMDLLAGELDFLRGENFDATLTGFDAAELDELFGEKNKTVKEDDFDLNAALEKATFANNGDIWTLGRHRLMCGDATDADTVRTLMAGCQANLVLTDPPYAVAYKSASGLTIKNDNLKPDAFYNFLLSSFRCLADSLESNGSAYIFHADTEGETFRKAFREAGFHLSGTCIWAKDSFVMGRSPYQWQHEPILYGWLKSGKHKWYAGRKEATLWNYPKPKRNANHPTSKPLELLAYPISNSTQANGIVLDTFGGSGSTLITCEQTGRVCHMLELDEKYASVILRRYAEFMGNGGADILCERGGRQYKYHELVKDVVRG